MSSLLASQSRGIETKFDSPRHRRTRSTASTSLNVPCQGPRLHRRNMSSTSTVPEIVIEPPVSHFLHHLKHSILMHFTYSRDQSLRTFNHATNPLLLVDRSVRRRRSTSPTCADCTYLWFSCSGGIGLCLYHLYIQVKCSLAEATEREPHGIEAELPRLTTKETRWYGLQSRYSRDY